VDKETLVYGIFAVYMTWVRQTYLSVKCHNCSIYTFPYSHPSGLSVHQTFPVCAASHFMYTHFHTADNLPFVLKNV